MRTESGMNDFYSRDFHNRYLKAIWKCGARLPGMKSAAGNEIDRFAISSTCGRYGPSRSRMGCGHMAFGGHSDDVWGLPDPASLRRNGTGSPCRRFRSETGTRGRWTDAPPALFHSLIDCPTVLVLQAVSGLDRGKQVLIPQISNFFLSDILNVGFRPTRI